MQRVFVFGVQFWWQKSAARFDVFPNLHCITPSSPFHGFIDTRNQSIAIKALNIIDDVIFDF